MNGLLKILVIDDSEDDRLLYSRCLKKGAAGNYEVSETASGEDGLAKMDKEGFACVLLDYSLPGRNGVEILKRIRAKHSAVPVVILTGQGSEKVAVAAMQEGAQNYISKTTITTDSLENVIQQAIQRCAMQQRIAEQRESLEIFARALAHDLKEPVRTIRSLLDLIRAEASLTGKAASHLQSIKSAAERMNSLIDTVHLYTRLDGSDKIDCQICDANEIVEAAKENIDQLVCERQAVITCHRLPQIYANRTQMILVVQNLLCNAIEHCTAAVHVEVRAEQAPGHWILRVSDNGPGIDKRDADKLFKPFKRLSGHEVKGFGLGLAICKRIVELHDGKICYEAKSGNGATFSFTIPEVVPLPVASTASLQSAKVRNGGRGHRFATCLLVDDNDLDIEIAQLFLFERSRLQCNLLTAHDGREAMDMLHKGDIDLMLLDINMPKMDGFEVLAQMSIKNLLKRTAVVMCSTSTYEEDVSKAAELGSCGYLPKPPDFDRLKSIIEKSTMLQIVEADDNLHLLRAA